MVLQSPLTSSLRDGQKEYLFENWKYNGEKRDMRYVYCKSCFSIIILDDLIRSANGKLKPLNLDLTRHDCRQSNYQQTNQNPTPQVQEIDTTVPLLAEILEQLKVTNEWLECLSVDKSPKDWESKYK
jgi:hypothetical protein